ncbi:hypothetical protein [Lacticaseibacillus kribbianus]|uniref:hypothetical protein n=1 Tax=Lacticaseibacillus kribbianus TaxID=2926292 RepID=UPI001CD4C665|nr:hypothetical protein [Lacticaseibacillus kribbianus]
MADEARLDRLIQQLGEANRRLQQLVDVDYPTAAYKGFSQNGDTLADVKAAIDEAEARVQRLEEQLAAADAADE